MNCIYKTNKFRMSILHVMDVTSFNTSFTIVVAFFKEETQLFMY